MRSEQIFGTFGIVPLHDNNLFLTAKALIRKDDICDGEPKCPNRVLNPSFAP